MHPHHLNGNYLAGLGRLSIILNDRFGPSASVSQCASPHGMVSPRPHSYAGGRSAAFRQRQALSPGNPGESHLPHDFRKSDTLSKACQISTLARWILLRNRRKPVCGSHHAGSQPARHLQNSGLTRDEEAFAPRHIGTSLVRRLRRHVSCAHRVWRAPIASGVVRARWRWAGKGMLLMVEEERLNPCDVCDAA